jgi:hypothetical protein
MSMCDAHRNVGDLLWQRWSLWFRFLSCLRPASLFGSFIANSIATFSTPFRSCEETSFRNLIVPFLLFRSPNFFAATIDAYKRLVDIPNRRWIVRVVRHLL